MQVSLLLCIFYKYKEKDKRKYKVNYKKDKHKYTEKYKKGKHKCKHQKEQTLNTAEGKEKYQCKKNTITKSKRTNTKY